jgi:ribosomal protein S18 acetylase RimI-like enzyme
MAFDYKICELDSSIMNFGVAKINEYDVSINPIEIINLLRSKSISLIYLRSNLKHDKDNNKIQYFPGIKFMVQNVKYTMEIIRNNDTLSANSPSDIIEYNDEISIRHLEKLAGACNLHSHLRKDSLIRKKHADKLYIQWLHKSLTDRNSGGVLVAKAKNKIIGMLVFSKKFSSINVDLISVDKNMRRQRYGTKLIAALTYFAKNTGATSITVETQATNIPANGLYENYGFKIINKQNIFHCWI